MIFLNLAEFGVLGKLVLIVMYTKNSNVTGIIHGDKNQSFQIIH